MYTFTGKGSSLTTSHSGIHTHMHTNTQTHCHRTVSCCMHRSRSVSVLRNAEAATHMHIGNREQGLHPHSKLVIVHVDGRILSPYCAATPMHIGNREQGLHLHSKLVIVHVDGCMLSPYRAVLTGAHTEYALCGTRWGSPGLATALTLPFVTTVCLACRDD